MKHFKNILDMFPRPEGRAPRVLLLSIIILFLLALLVLLAVLLLTVEQSVTEGQRDPPLVYSAPSYPAERDMLCPGETLVYTNSLRVNRPAIVWFVTTWFDRGKNLPVIPASSEQFQVFTEPISITRRRTNPVPNLPPGSYEMRFAAAEGNSRAAMHVVDFTIPRSCPALPIALPIALPTPSPVPK